ncbi:hypothetical protein TP41_18595 [Xanthomonas euvesicatoria pv. citrumelonis]|nr:hypothetical protein TP41_18595 [Xanthomonas euvesicatoria pv. citrumelonis]
MPFVVAAQPIPRGQGGYQCGLARQCGHDVQRVSFRHGRRRREEGFRWLRGHWSQRFGIQCPRPHCHCLRPKRQTVVQVEFVNHYGIWCLTARSLERTTC